MGPLSYERGSAGEGTRGSPEMLMTSNGGLVVQPAVILLFSVMTVAKQE